MSAPLRIDARQHRREPSAQLLHDALTLAVAVHGGDPIEIAAALAGVPHTDAMILTLAALVDVDGPVNRWWESQQIDDPTPCRLCELPLGRRRAHARSPYHEQCRIEVRRQTWRNKEEKRRRRGVGADSGAA